MATHSSVLAWRIPGMGEPGGLQSMGSHRLGHEKWLSSSSRVTSTLLMVSAIICMNNSLYIKSVCWTSLTGNWMPQHSPSLDWFLIAKWPPRIRAVILHSPRTAHIQATTKLTFPLPCALFHHHNLRSCLQPQPPYATVTDCAQPTGQASNPVSLNLEIWSYLLTNSSRAP